MENALLQAILSRTSVRSFTGEAVSHEDLVTVLRAAMAAPSAVNIQPWAFVAVTRREMMDALRDLLPYAKMLDRAGAAVVICGIPEKDEIYSRKYWVMDCSAAAQNVLLACHALRLGAVWTAVYPEEERVAAVRRLLNIPERIVPLCVIPVGVPSHPNAPKDKFDEGNIHWEQW